MNGKKNTKNVKGEGERFMPFSYNRKKCTAHFIYLKFTVLHCTVDLLKLYKMY